MLPTTAAAAVTVAIAALQLLAPANANISAVTLSNSTHMQPLVAGGCSQFLPNIDLTSANIGTLSPMPNLKKGNCFDACRDISNCYATVWTDYNGGTCWHKATFGYGAVVKIGALTIISSCEPTWLRLNNCDMPGGDITSAKRARPEDCFAICKVTEVCAAFTWSDYEGGTCWLKSAVVPCTGAGNKHSGAMGRGGYW